MLDSEMLFKVITNDDNLKDVPLMYIVQVAASVIEAINSGQCMIKWEE